MQQVIEPTARKLSQKALVNLIADGEPARQAAWECAFAGAEFGVKAAEATWPEGQGEAFNEALGLGKDLQGGVKSCVTAIRQMEQKLARAPKAEWGPILPATTYEAFTLAAVDALQRTTGLRWGCAKPPPGPFPRGKPADRGYQPWAGLGSGSSEATRPRLLRLYVRACFPLATFELGDGGGDETRDAKSRGSSVFHPGFGDSYGL